MIDICICTHSPEKNVFRQVLDAIADQTLSAEHFRVLVVDNASRPAIDLGDEAFVKARAHGIEIHIFRESRLGIAHARIRALRESRAEAVVFVDDDNILDTRFLEVARDILNTRPEIGCFSGKILLHESLRPPTWIEPLLGSLAMRNAGDESIVGFFRGNWSPWVPASTASMVLRREVAEAFLRIHASRPEFGEFGRRGRFNLLSLMSGEDYFIALSAAEAGLQSGYFPNLVMHHLIRENRFQVRHMAKLMFSYALTDIKREVYLKNPPIPFGKEELKYRLLSLNFRHHKLRARFCQWLYEVPYVVGKTLRLARSNRPFYLAKDSNELSG